MAFRAATISFAQENFTSVGLNATDLGPYLLQDQPLFEPVPKVEPNACGICTGSSGSPSRPCVQNFQIWPENIREESIKRLKKAGVNYLRVTIPWPFIEKSRGVYDWRQMDNILKYIKDNNIEVLGMPLMVPKWASASTRREYPSLNYEYDKGITWSYPADMADWDKWIKAIVGRYGCGSGGRCQVKDWEIWNEPETKFLDFNRQLNYQNRVGVYKDMLTRALNIIRIMTPAGTKAYILS